MKKLQIWLVLFMLAIVLASCGGSKETSTNVATDAPTLPPPQVTQKNSEAGRRNQTSTSEPSPGGSAAAPPPMGLPDPAPPTRTKEPANQMPQYKGMFPLDNNVIATDQRSAVGILYLYDSEQNLLGTSTYVNISVYILVKTYIIEITIGSWVKQVWVSGMPLLLGKRQQIFQMRT